MNIGDNVRMRVVITDTTGTLVSDATVILRVLSPSLAETAPTVTNSGSGVYYGEEVVTEDGTWCYRFEASGTAVGAEEDAFIVKRSKFS